MLCAFSNNHYSGIENWLECELLESDVPKYVSLSELPEQYCIANQLGLAPSCDTAYQNRVS